MQQNITISLLIVLFLARSISSAQAFPSGLHSLDTPFDPRSVAMGESFVAVRGNHHAAMYNPAGLSGIEGGSVGFSRRNFNHLDLTSDSKYIAFTGTLSSTIADFSIVYSRFHLGELLITTSENPEPSTRARVSDYVLGLSAATEIIDRIDAGILVKTFRQVFELTGGYGQIPTYNNPLLVDLGVIGRIDGRFTNTSLQYSLAGGMAVQNYGTDLKVKINSSSTIVTLPRFWRTGIAFYVSTPQLNDLGVSPVSILVTGEYRVVLNSYLDPNEDFWGFGSEITVLELFAGRIGWFIQSHTSIYGKKGDPSLRYGLGLRIPFGLLGLTKPITFRADYAAIPLNTNIPFFMVQNSTLHTFSLELMYENNIVSAVSEQ